MTTTPTIQFYDRQLPLDEALDALAQALAPDHPSAVNAPQTLRRWATELRYPTTERETL